MNIVQAVAAAAILLGYLAMYMFGVTYAQAGPEERVFATPRQMAQAMVAFVSGIILMWALK